MCTAYPSRPCYKLDILNTFDRLVGYVYKISLKWDVMLNIDDLRDVLIVAQQTHFYHLLSGFPSEKLLL